MPQHAAPNMQGTTAVLVWLWLVAWTVQPACSADPGLVTQAMYDRSLVSVGDPSRLRSVFARARHGDPIVIAAIGGSITAGGRQTADPGRRYVAQVAAWFTEKFPKAKVDFVNAGIGSTNSAYGALRVQRDVIERNPDLAIVEYAVNDSHPAAKFDESYEGVLRQLLSSAKHPAVIELFFMHKDGVNAQPEQTKLGNHYGLPMISFRDAFYPEYQAGRLTWDDFYADVVHPNDAGHGIASDLLRHFLNLAMAKASSGDMQEPANVGIPQPMISDMYEQCSLFRPRDLKPVSQDGWSVSTGGAFECGVQGGRLVYESPGRMLLLGIRIPKAASGKVTMAVDGAAPVMLSGAEPNRPVYTGLQPGRHLVCIQVDPYDQTEGDTNTIQIWWGGASGLR